MRVSASLIAALLTVALPTLACALPKPPEQVVREYVATLKGDTPADVAPMIHPSEIASLRAQIEPIIRKLLRRPEGRDLFPQFVDPYNVKSMREMDDLEFCATFVRWVFARQPNLIASIKESEVKVLGDVLEGEKSYVVARLRTKVGEKETENAIVIVVLFDGENPKLAMPPEISRTAEMLLTQFTR